MNISDTNPKCLAAMPYYYEYLCGQQDQIPQDISVHIAGCPDCQNEVQWLKEADAEAEGFTVQKLETIPHAAQMQLHCSLIDQPVRCSTIKPFLPIQAIPDIAVRTSTPVTAHLEACAACAHDLETLKQLNLSPEQLSDLSEMLAQKQISNPEKEQKSFLQNAMLSLSVIRKIIDRPDSGVVTCFRAEGSPAAKSEKVFTVEAARPLPTDTPADNTPVPKQRAAIRSSARPRWFLKPVAAAAAIVIAAILLFQSPSIQATDLGQIYAALKNVHNIMITQYGVDSSNPLQKIWISNSLGIKLYRNDTAFVLYDIHNNTQRTKVDSASNVQQTDIDQVTAQSITETMAIPWGLLPFNNASELPVGATWEKVQPATDVSVPEQSEIYDLFWSIKTISGKEIDHQWRCYVDASTKCPFKVEWYEKNQQTQKYELTNFSEVAYPTQDQIQEVIDQAGL